MSSTLSGAGCRGMMGCVPFLNGSSTHQESLEGPCAFVTPDDVVLHSSSVINDKHGTGRFRDERTSAWKTLPVGKSG